jgi:hypothetical protein
MEAKKVIRSETRKVINRLFPFKDGHAFDPGLWAVILQRLPEGYTIPDAQFTSELKRMNDELARIDKI